jgi:ATP synthase protein I
LLEALEEPRRALVNNRKEPSMLSALALASGIGIQFAAAVLVGLGLGWLADRLAHTSPWFLLAGLVLGIAAGAYGVVRAALRMMREQ